MHEKLATDIVDMLESMEPEPRAAKIAYLARFLGPLPLKLARTSEMEYLIIKRNRSGQDSGELEYAINVNAVCDLRGKERSGLIKVCEQAIMAVNRHLSTKI